MEFVIPPQFKNIVVLVSGGADSALLLYLTIKFLITNNYDAKVSAITCANGAKLNWNARRSASVIDYVLRRTNFQNFDMHYTFYRDEQEDPYFEEVMYDLVVNSKADVIIHGTTRNPPKDTKVTTIQGDDVLLRDYPGNVEERNESFEDFHTCEEFPEGSFHSINAWMNVDKKFIADQYKKFNLERELLSLTRSCEARPHHFGYNKTIQGAELAHFEKPCGKCWWCLEKKWAFGHF